MSFSGEVEGFVKATEQKQLKKLVFEKLQTIPQFHISEEEFEDANESSYEYILKFYHK